MRYDDCYDKVLLTPLEKYYKEIGEGIMTFEYDKFYDKRGNEKENYIIERYTRGVFGNWNKDCEFSTHKSNTFVIDDKIYYRDGDVLIPVNMKKDLAYLSYERIKCKDNDYRKIIRNVQLISSSRQGKVSQEFSLRCEEYSNGKKYYYSHENINNYETKYKDESLDALKARLNGEINAVKAYANTIDDEYIKACENERESFLKGVLKMVNQIDNRGGIE